MYTQRIDPLSWQGSNGGGNKAQGLMAVTVIYGIIINIQNLSPNTSQTKLIVKSHVDVAGEVRRVVGLIIVDACL